MKINNVELNKVNFWYPFCIALLLSLLFWVFGRACFIYMAAKTITENVQPYLEIVRMSLYGLPIMLILTSIAVYFVMRRLLTSKSEKVFYFELPIFIIAFSLLEYGNVLLGLIIAGPGGLSKTDGSNFILFPVLFVIIWLFVLILSLYLFYKSIYCR